jgi:hypothetical protein
LYTCVIFIFRVPEASAILFLLFAVLHDLYNAVHVPIFLFPLKSISCVLFELFDCSGVRLCYLNAGSRVTVWATGNTSRQKHDFATHNDDDWKFF